MGTGKKSFLLAIAIYLMVVPQAWAGFSVIQALDFGRWLVPGNSEVRGVQLRANGTYTPINGLVMLEPPKQGVYLFTELPNTPIVSVTAVMVSSMQRGGGPAFTLSDFDVEFTPITNGETTISVGARASTSGNQQMYSNGAYIGELLIELHM
jgi:hypothetical protein